MTNKHKDSTGYSWQTFNDKGEKTQENSKTFDGEHAWYDVKTASVGWHGANITAEEKKIAGKYFNETATQRWFKK